MGEIVALYFNFQNKNAFDVCIILTPSPYRSTGYCRLVDQYVCVCAVVCVCVFVSAVSLIFAKIYISICIELYSLSKQRWCVVCLSITFNFFFIEPCFLLLFTIYGIQATYAQWKLIPNVYDAWGFPVAVTIIWHLHGVSWALFSTWFNLVTVNQYYTKRPWLTCHLW